MERVMSVFRKRAVPETLLLMGLAAASIMLAALAS